MSKDAETESPEPPDSPGTPEVEESAGEQEATPDTAEPAETTGASESGEDVTEATDGTEVAAVIPEIRQVIGGLLFASQTPLTVKQLRNVFKRAIENYEGITKEFEGITEAQVAEGLADLKRELERSKCGVMLAEVSNGFRLQNDKACGPWIRQLLEKGRVSRLSKPALETLAIIAYRQPCTRADVEAIRGVSVDAMIRNLLEMQLLKVVGRSELPGRPWLFGTTNLFMEHFGLKDLEDLPGMSELRRQPEPEPESEAVGEEEDEEDAEEEVEEEDIDETEASAFFEDEEDEDEDEDEGDEEE